MNTDIITSIFLFIHTCFKYQFDILSTHIYLIDILYFLPLRLVIFVNIDFVLSVLVVNNSTTESIITDFSLNTFEREWN